MNEINDSNYLEKLFTDEVKGALNKGGQTSDETDNPLEVFIAIRDGSSLFKNVTDANFEALNAALSKTDTSSLTTLYQAFHSSTATSLSLNLNTTNVTSMLGMFAYCESLQHAPDLYTGKVTTMKQMFSNCKAMVDAPLYDTALVTDMQQMFENCYKLSTVPPYDTTSVTTMATMFRNDSALISIPKFNTPNVTNTTSTFYYCTALTTIPELDMRNVTAASSMLERCGKLTEIHLKNIKTNLQVGSGSTYGHLITKECLIELIYELRNTGSSQTLTIGAANLEKLTDVYVKTIEITDEMRAADDLVGEKLPFVVCESTDEGAMLISQYVSAKNWALK